MLFVGAGTHAPRLDEAGLVIIIDIITIYSASDLAQLGTRRGHLFLRTEYQHHNTIHRMKPYRIMNGLP